MNRTRVFAVVSAIALLLGWFVGRDTDSAGADEALDRTVCQLIEKSADSYGLPVPYLTRLIFRESGFRPDVVSRSGARGIAQFMPATAAALGLVDPLDPEQAIPKAANHLSDLRNRFGNLGLAAAAYNGGMTRVSKWLAGKGDLRTESLDYVVFVTGRGVETWRPQAEPFQARLREARLGSQDTTLVRDVAAPSTSPEPGCLQQLAELRDTQRTTRVALVSRRTVGTAPTTHPLVDPVRPVATMARWHASRPLRHIRTADLVRRVTRVRAPERRIATAPLPAMALLSDDTSWRSLSGAVEPRGVVASRASGRRTARVAVRARWRRHARARGPMIARTGPHGKAAAPIRWSRRGIRSASAAD